MWYSIESIFTCYVEGILDDHPIQDKKIFLIDVKENDLPQEKAETMGRLLEHEYINENREKVSWQLKEILEIQELCEEDLYDGVEVFSRLEPRNID